VLNTEWATYEALSDRVVRVTGSRFEPAENYTVKLEGAAIAGYQTIAIGGIRDGVIIRQLDQLASMADGYFRNKIRDVFGGQVDPSSIEIRYLIYGRDAVLGELEPLRHETGHEVGVLITVTAPTQSWRMRS
jgi:hypothetical protein